MSKGVSAAGLQVSACPSFAVQFMCRELFPTAVNRILLHTPKLC